MRYRSLVGTMTILAGLTVYAGAVAFAGERLTAAHWLVQVGFYAIAGTIWVVPAAYLTRWMQRPPPRATGRFDLKSESGSD
ncbi:MAG: DUF2842 domain-containing protein [Alphaproteobacteria bacterium]|nr:DUF2842 domain-containing protein [Alphaproteobacteria bacterium]